MHRSILGLAAIVLATPAIAQDEWIKVSSSDSGSEHSIRPMDIPTWSPSNRSNQVWLKSELAKEESISFSKVIALNVVNCPDRSFKTLSIRAYYQDGTNEELPTDPDRTIALSSDSVIGHVADVVCHATRSE